MKKRVVVRAVLILLVPLAFITQLSARRQSLPKQEVRQKQDAAQIAVFSDEDRSQHERREDVVALVKRGVDYFNENSLEQVGRAFTHTKEFVHGELYLFVYDLKGRCLSHGQQAELLYKDLSDVRDAFGVFVIQELIKKAKDGGGWVEYEWRGSTKVSYVEPITKGDKSYLVGCGYHPHIKSDIVVNLVKGAVTQFNQKVAEGKLVVDAMSDFSYPLGKFIMGDLYIWAYDFEGNMYANGDRPGLIGLNRIEFTDDRGMKLVQEIIKRLQEAREGIWIEYVFNGAVKRAYAQQVEDAKGKKYFIACGYYPEVSRKDAIDLVRRGYQVLKKTGESNTFRIMSNKQDNTFRNGGLFLFAYDMEGNCVAHGDNAEFVGQNQWAREDEEGQPFVRHMIEKVKKTGNGWMNVKLRNAFLSTYLEKVEIGLKEYIIGTYLFPINKRETMILLAESGAGYLRSNEPRLAFAEFVKKDGKFFRGDLSVFAFGMNGICYAYGDSHRLIWRDLTDAQDDDGKFFVREFIETARRGSGSIQYKLNQVPKLAHVQLVEKDGTQYIVGSSYYQSAVGIR